MLMDALIENNDSSYIAMREFMQNKNDPRVQLVQTAYELIADIGEAIGGKFGQNVLTSSWQANADDYELEAFVKAEGQSVDVAPQEPVVEWELDQSILGGGKSLSTGKLKQEEFFDLITLAQFKYKQFFENLSSTILLSPEKAKRNLIN